MRDTDVIAAGGFVATNEPWPAAVLVLEGSPPRWRLPKGLVEENESLERAAVREVLEETGLECEVLSELSTVSWEYVFEGRQLRKHVVFFLMRVRAMAALPLQDEVVRGRALVSIDVVPELLAFDSERDVAKLAIKRLKKLDREA